jgi:hypothetical protein
MRKKLPENSFIVEPSTDFGALKHPFDLTPRFTTAGRLAPVLFRSDLLRTLNSAKT